MDPLHTGGYTAPLRAGSVAAVEGVFRRLEDHTSDVELFSVEDTATGETFLLPSWPVDVNLGEPVALGAIVRFVSNQPDKAHGCSTYAPTPAGGWINS